MGLNLLETYTDYLFVQTGQATAIGLSNVLDGQVIHDQIILFIRIKFQPFQPF